MPDNVRGDDYDQYELPRAVDAEQAILGALMLSNDSYESASRVLKPEHFFDALHRRIFECIGRLVLDGRKATPISVKTFLGDYDIGEGVMLSQYLIRIATTAPLVGNVTDYSQMIADLAARRQIIGAANDMRQLAYDTPIGTRPAQVAAGAIEVLDELVRDADTRNYRTTAGKAGMIALERAQNMQRGGKPAGIKTGLTALDNIIGTLKPGALVIIAGRPGQGKSACLYEIALNVSLRSPDQGCILFSLEMPADEVSERMLSSLVHRKFNVRIPYTLIAEGRVNDDQLERLWEAQRLLDALPIEIDAQPGVFISQIFARARRLKQRMAAAGRKLTFIGIDHMQIVKGSGGRTSRVEEIEQISNASKIMAMELDCPVIILSQLNREIENRPIKDRKPQAHDLRGSGSIEQDADVILGVFREAEYLLKLADKTPEQESRLQTVRNDLEIGVLKNRGGRTGNARQRISISTNYISDRDADLQPSLADEPLEAAF